MKQECRCDNCKEFNDLLFPLILQGEEKVFCKSCYHLYLAQ